VTCEETGPWQDGYQEVDITVAYDVTDGDLTVRITNTLDQNPDDESIGYGDLHLYYHWNDGSVPMPDVSPAFYDHAYQGDATDLWSNDC
jgi:hypothetical protein